MEQSEVNPEKISAGEKASISNTGKKPLIISITNEGGCNLAMELQPGQSIGFDAGESNASVALHDGDPATLLIIKPETP